MRQLVGLSCVLCGKSIGSIVDGRFCQSCGCPIHAKCARSLPGGDPAQGCAACGAKADVVQREKTLHREEERQHQAEAGGLAPPTSGWTVLLALPERFHSPFTMQMRDDMGSLEWQRREICVIGSRQVHEFRKVLDLALVRQPVSWVAALVMNILIIGLVFIGFFSMLTRDNPFTWILLVGMNVLLVRSTVTIKWIRVTYRDRSGAEASVYLLPVSPSGWRRFDGASQHLLAVLREDVLPARSLTGKTSDVDTNFHA